jgi:hypothetical protein
MFLYCSYGAAMRQSHKGLGQMTDEGVVDLAVARLLRLCRDADPDLQGLLDEPIRMPRRTLLKVLDDLAANDADVLSFLMRDEIVHTARLEPRSADWNVSMLVMEMIRNAIVTNDGAGDDTGEPGQQTQFVG